MYNQSITVTSKDLRALATLDIGNAKDILENYRIAEGILRNTLHRCRILAKFTPEDFSKDSTYRWISVIKQELQELSKKPATVGVFFNNNNCKQQLATITHRCEWLLENRDSLIQEQYLTTYIKDMTEAYHTIWEEIEVCFK